MSKIELCLVIFKKFIAKGSSDLYVTYLSGEKIVLL